MGAAQAAAEQPHTWAYTRRKFTRQEILLLLAQDYHGFRKLTGCKLSTARRYGHLIRHPQPNDITATMKPTKRPTKRAKGG